ncbi:hypothetical protein LCGC14_1057830 [marine sediment metagenome]|uniref:Uncharacterized protein n=1 Tax=marine sediment metagenome TaxID=412755 RepID=A0A0F9MM55_9ZZZZ
MKCHDGETCKHGVPDFVDCHECGAEALDRAVEMEIERKREKREAVHPYDVTVFYHCNVASEAI